MTRELAHDDLVELWQDLSAAVPGLEVLRGTTQVPGRWSSGGGDLDLHAPGHLLEAAHEHLEQAGFRREFAAQSYRRRMVRRRLGVWPTTIDLYAEPLFGAGFASVDGAATAAPEAALMRAVFDKHDLSYFLERHRPDDLGMVWRSASGRLAGPSGSATASLVAARLLAGRVARLRPDVALSSLRMRAARRTRLLREPAGFEVAFVGPDGSGKTTLVAKLMDRVPLPAQTIYMGGKDWQTWLMRKMVGKPGSMIPRHLEQGLRRRRGFFASRRGEVVMYERHPHETEPKEQHPLKRLLARSLFALYGWEVELAVMLTGDPELIFARKGEHDPATLARLDSWLSDMARRQSGEVITLDSTELDPEAIATRVGELLIERYQRRNAG